MTLDDEPIGWREMARRDREYYDEVLHQEWLVQEACESSEARETYWQGVFAQDPTRHLTYDDDRPGIDRRMFGP